MDRKRICLSPRAWSVLEEDVAAFQIEDTTTGLINAIVIASWESSEASISLARAKKESELARSLQESRYLEKYRKDVGLVHFDQKREPLQPADLDAVSRLSNSYAQSLVARMLSYPRGESKVIRFRKEVCEVLGLSDGRLWTEAEYYPRVTEYVKALIEVYAEKPFYEREAIVFGGILSGLTREIEAAPEDKRILSLTLRGPSRPRFEVKPYRIMADIGMNYHYLVCLSKPCVDPAAPYKVVSFRLSRIEGFRPYEKSHGSGKLTKAQVKDIDQAIKERGVQYLVGGSLPCKVYLTEGGWRKYQSILHLRPTARHVELLPNGERVLDFDCTLRQIGDYFFKFGSDVKVVEPKELSMEFEERYRTAFELYSSEG